MMVIRENIKKEMKEKVLSFMYVRIYLFFYFIIKPTIGPTDPLGQPEASLDHSGFCSECIAFTTP